jgi:hypothetical protein
MTVTISLNPEIEEGLKMRARSRGVSLDEYVQELVTKEVSVSTTSPSPEVGTRFANLSQLLLDSPLSGADLDLSRSCDYPRPVGIE